MKCVIKNEMLWDQNEMCLELKLKTSLTSEFKKVILILLQSKKNSNCAVLLVDGYVDVRMDEFWMKFIHIRMDEF